MNNMQMSNKTKQKISAAKLGKSTKSWSVSGQEHYMYKEKPKYRAIHMWADKLMGQPHLCEFCRNTNLGHRQYHWANVSGNYLRDKNDWKRLCVKCHKKYDKNKINI